MKNFTYLLRKFCALLLLLSLLHITGFSQQIAQGLTASNGVFIGFLEYKPTDYNADPNLKYPLIIFLHGIGERGNGTSELQSVAGNAIPKYINAGHPMRFFWNGKWETFLVLSPQLSWSYGNWQDFYIDEMIKYAKQNLRVDTNRIILTGLSLGGGGVWQYASSTPEKAKQFAAIGPVCGTCAIQNACNLANANLPVWAFHALDDGIVGVGCTTSAISAINGCNPSTKPLMTLYNNGSHFIWDRAYDTVYNWQNPNIYEWFLGQNKNLPANILPNANAGPDQAITAAIGTVTLNGTGSTDPDGNIVRYIWRFLSGPPAGNILTPSAGITTITNLILPGTYQYELTVVDNRCGQKTDVVAVTVTAGAPPPNQPPVANAGADISLTLPANNTILNGSGSWDPDGVISGYSWTAISGPSQYTIANANAASTTLSNLVQGTYAFRLVVSDIWGAVDDDTVSVTVNAAAPNFPPTANAGPDITITLPTNNTTLNGGASTDPEGNLTGYSWTWVSGPTQYTVTNPIASSTALTNLVQGTYSFRLLVSDNQGLTDDDTVTVTVNAAIPPANQPPVANAGFDISLTLPTNSTTLNGTGSSDPDGTISTYSWTEVSGPAQYTIANPAAASTALSNLVQGTYLFSLVVTDNGGLTNSDTVVVTVGTVAPPPNQPPVANAGADINIALPVNSTTLNGTASSDPDGTISTYSWIKIAGPTQYTIANSASASTTLSNLAQGTYSFRLVVGDNGGLTSDDTVMVTVNAAPPPPNQPPVANAGADISISLPVNSTTLNGTASSDPDGNLSGYSWTKIGGPVQFTIANPTAASTALTYLVQGTYSFHLLVTDNQGLTNDDTVIVTVNPGPPPPPNQPPVANAGVNINITLPVNSTTLNGTASSDPDGNLSGYSWTKINGPAQYTIANSNASSTALTNLVQGTYSFRLLVSDNQGLTDDDTVIVTVNPAPPNQPPVANAGTDINIILPSNSTTLNGTASSDPDGTISGYSWIKISGPSQYTIANAGGASTALSNLVQGAYSFRLIVTDNGGLTDNDTVIVTVNAAPPAPPINQSPVANAGANISLVLPANSTTLNGTASSDPDGTISNYSWTKISGPAQYAIANAGTASAALSNLVQGTYLFRLVVTDNGGLTDDDTVQVVVNPVPNTPPVANAGNDITTTLSNSSIHLNGSASYDPDGSIAAYNWIRVSGPGTVSIVNSTTATPDIVGAQVGDYIFELTVTDDRGATNKDEVKVTVLAPPNQAPVAMAGKDTTISLPSTITILNGSQSFDSDGSISSYQWKQVNGSLAAVIVNMNNAVTNVFSLQPGEYIFELSVTDNKGAIGRDSVKVSVVNNLRYDERLITYPNPATNTLNIRCISDYMGKAQMTVYDMNGRIIKAEEFDKNQPFVEKALSIISLKVGIYYLEIIIDNKKKMITKFVKN